MPEGQRVAPSLIAADVEITGNLSSKGAIHSEHVTLRQSSHAGGEIAYKVLDLEHAAVLEGHVQRLKETVTGYFEREAVQQLKMIGIEQDRSLQGLLVEAVNDLLRKYEKSPVG